MPAYNDWVEDFFAPWAEPEPTKALKRQRKACRELVRTGIRAIITSPSAAGVVSLALLHRRCGSCPTRCKVPPA